jgi:hypothetical protein
MVARRDRGRGAWCATVALAVVLPAASAWSTVALTVSRPDGETLYSPDGDPDCSKLSKLKDEELPLNVVRLRASVPGAAPDQVRYQWSLPTPAVGVFAADLDLGTGEETSNVRALCGEFGNACVLTKETLRFYNLASILWIAPACSFLPDDTKKAFGGGAVRLRVKATLGKRKVGAGKVTLGYGHRGTVTLYGQDQTGIGTRAVEGQLFTRFGMTYDTTGLPAPKSITIDDGSGAVATLDPIDCPSGPFCTVLQYNSPGRFTAVGSVELTDGSLLCDKLTLEVPGVVNVGQLTAIITPRRATYLPGDVVNVRLVYKNVSPRKGVDCIELGGAGALSCSEGISVGGTMDSRSMSFDFRHCSATLTQFCENDAQCAPSICHTCSDNERCLTKSHCSVTTTQGCSHDSECAPPVCARCEDTETCTRVLEAQPVCVRIGRSVELLNETVTVDNVLPDTAHLSDTWTATALNDSMSRQASFKYAIRGKKKSRLQAGRSGRARRIK